MLTKTKEETHRVSFCFIMNTEVIPSLTQRWEKSETVERTFILGLAS